MCLRSDDAWYDDGDDGEGSTMNDTGAEFWSDDQSRKRQRRIHCDADKAVAMIRAKLNERSDGHRVLWRQFDANGSGRVSYEEFCDAVELKTGLLFTDQILSQVMARYDDDGSNYINFRKFCRNVLGTSTRDSSSVDTSALQGREEYTSADAGNSAMMLKRKVRMATGDLRRAFKDLDRSGHGVLNYDDMRVALHRMTIDLNERQFTSLMQQLDVNGDEQISYAEFLDFFRKEDEGMGLKQVEGVTVDQAVELIRSKINEKMDSRPGALNRAFQQFDADGSGGISEAEFKQAMLLKTGLKFEDGLLRKVMDVFDDDGSGEINFRKFCTLVMGSSRRDAGSALDCTLAGRRDYVSTDGGNSEMMLFRKVRMSMRSLRNSFKDVDSMGRGKISVDDFEWVLHTHNINMGDRQYKNLLTRIGGSRQTGVNWRRFLDFFKQDLSR
jgi:calmodulin